MEGSYGWVSRAIDLDSGDVVALKKPRLLDQSMLRPAGGVPITVLREISVLKLARNHPNVVTLREVIVGRDVDIIDERETEEPAFESAHPSGTWNPNTDTAVSEDGTPRPIYLVLDFIEHDLAGLLRHHNLTSGGDNSPSRPLFGLSETKTLIHQIASGLGFLHSKWIIHRDLKPSNILLDNRGHIRIADFGLARIVSFPPPPGLTRTVATLYYRAPEVVLHKRNYHFPIDVWSVGCILGELVTGTPIFAAHTEPAQWENYTAVLGYPKADEWPEMADLLDKASKHGVGVSPASSSSSGRDKAKPSRSLAGIVGNRLPASGLALLSRMLAMNPDRRPTANSVANDPFMTESPPLKSPLLFPSFPSFAKRERHELKARRPDGMV